MKKLKIMILIAALFISEAAGGVHPKVYTKALNATTSTTETSTKENLKRKIEEKASDKISKEYYDDFDGDGVKELFAVTGPEEDVNEIWYANNTQVKRVYHDGLSVYPWSPKICKVSSRQKLVVFETGGYGSGSVSVCYYVSNGNPVRVKKAGELLTHTSGKEFVVHQTAFDMCKDSDGVTCGHTYKAYYLRWNGKKFIEYKGKKITLSELKKYKGANKYINQVKKIGYKIGSIYYRSNGIINVNLSKKSDGLMNYENITFKLKEKSVYLQVCCKTGKNIVEKSSYSGIYRAKGF